MTQLFPLRTDYYYTRVFLYKSSILSWPWNGFDDFSGLCLDQSAASSAAVLLMSTRGCCALTLTVLKWVRKHLTSLYKVKTAQSCFPVTSVFLCVVVGLLAVNSFALFVTRRFSGPDHQRRVGPAHRQQHGVVVGPADVCHIGAVTHVLLKLGKLALRSVWEREVRCELWFGSISTFKVSSWRHTHAIY